jgi:tetrahydromethanopterin S-methyltransferase subunit B
MNKLLLGVVASLIAAGPCLADVIPTRRIDRNSAAEQKVKARLEQLGVTSQEAERQVSNLTPQDTAYFAQNPERVQAAAGLYWYEWVFGLGFAAIIAIILIARVYR